MARRTGGYRLGFQLEFHNFKFHKAGDPFLSFDCPPYFTVF
jgi:hypothetical protein